MAHVRLHEGAEPAMVHAGHIDETDRANLRGVCGTFLGWLELDGRTWGYDRKGIVVDEPVTCLWCVASRRLLPRWR